MIAATGKGGLRRAGDSAREGRGRWRRGAREGRWSGEGGTDEVGGGAGSCEGLGFVRADWTGPFSYWAFYWTFF